ncbi:AfsR/SARP family transcriptional regulator [Pseudonocardia abyssalis]|uniref:AAA family ATPase n=1 Tax=Pseudonocardia abyssalis TaxID=2792008 RepID=A0ABS6UZ84_9PSEU|nr:AfsR/SARP family transcriptional regulator [Pseudonocardia abyssalis]MBW0117853.1 AAA family ATPase [Pseudonocardia abyssalis]MBW0137556.1 AAA family ATPase [Pseudonocardia abyssalis]
MQFRVLGPLEVVSDGRPVDLGSPKLRALLTLLLADHGRVVPLDRINETLWAGEPPATATGTLQSYVSQLRRLLEPDRAPRAAPRVLLTRPPGYLLDADDLDVVRFERLLADGQRLLAAGRPAEADALLIDALALWRGEPFSDLGDGERAAVTADRARLAELRAVALERHVEALLADGRPESAVAELERLVAVHPMRERLWGSLMLALYRTGRQADALRAFTTCRDLLRDELGIDPGPELRRLEQAILTQDATVDGPQPVPAPVPVTSAPVEPPRRTGFVGRRTELSALVGRLSAAADGSGSVVLVGGEAGIGKTRLAEEAVAAAAAVGARVAWSRCADEAAAPALWPWTQVLRALGSDAGATMAGPGDSDTRRAELFERIAAALLVAAAERPLLVVLDDLHGADPLSLHLLRFLVGRIAAAPVLVLATLRDTADERTDALVHTLADLARERSVTRLRLGGLPADEVGELLVDRGLDDPALAGELRRRTEGNPFFLVELIELLRSERRLDARPASADIPASVRDVLERRLGRLPADTRALLTMAAVIGREFPLDVLEAASEIDAEQIAALLEPAVITGVVVEEGDGWVWRFGHELVRETIVAGLTRLQRARLHRRIAQALEGLPVAGHLDALAHHSYLAGPFAGAGAALRHALAAADAARDRFAHATAAGHLARAVELADPAQVQELLVALGRDLRAAGDLVGAHAALSRAITLATEAGDADRAAEATGVFGGVALWNWRAYGTSDATVVDRIDELLARTGDGVRRAELLGTLACELCYTDRRAEGMDAAREAARIARDLGDVALLGRALNNFYLAGWVPGQEAARRAVLDESLAMVGSGLPAHTEAVARLHRAALALRFAEPDLARADLARASRLATELGLAELRAQVSYQEAGHATLHGAWDDAEKHAEEAYALQRRTSLWGAGWCRLVQRMTVRRGQGRLDEVVNELVDGTTNDFPVLRPVALLALVELGDADGARRLLARTEVDIPVDWSTDFLRCAWGEVAAALGAPDPARLYRELLPQSAELVVAGTANAAWGSVHGVLGRLAARTGDVAAARTHLTEAVRVDTAVGAWPWADRARADLVRLGP